ncbi:hypothetical protein CgunFtcFv8_014978 [Champsocephalus gunnari]|uniref:Major facilitator superfamily domain-containing protein 4A n=1 Tax=Champsocephalus gunnari TaxID=52237 RepID=A0AAN8E7M4_CHAGU|nr:hypothetical protein CgunFtcFv8_014978 [Champsocephalus gunnari]
MKLLDERIWALFKCHWKYTLTYWSVFFSFGLCIAFLGPTVLDLRCQTHSSLQQITWVFFSQQFFLLVGSSLGGLFKKTLLSSLWTLFSCSLIISLVFSIIPLCNHVALLSVAMAIAGLAMGVIDTISNLQLVKLYQRDSATFLQALHFFIGVGALVSPLVADPFLSDDSCVLGSNWTLNSSSASDLGHLRNSLVGQGGAIANISQYPLHTEGAVITRVSYAFWIIALINLPVPAAVLALMCHERLPCSSPGTRLIERADSQTSRLEDRDEGEAYRVIRVFSTAVTLPNSEGDPATFFLLHALGGAVVFITDGIIGSYAGFVYTYAVSPPLLMEHRTAGYLDSIFWASITVGRLAFIYLSYRYSAPRLLAVSLLGVILVQCLLMIFYTSCVFLFIGTCVLGLCISSVFPSMLAFTEDILDYKGCATTVLVTSASTGEMLLQLIIGSVIDSQGSYSFLLCCTVMSFISFCLFLLFLSVQRHHRNGQTDPPQGTDLKEKPQPGGS